MTTQSDKIIVSNQAEIQSVMPAIKSSQSAQSLMAPRSPKPVSGALTLPDMSLRTYSQAIQHTPEPVATSDIHLPSPLPADMLSTNFHSFVTNSPEHEGMHIGLVSTTCVTSFGVENIGGSAVSIDHLDVNPLATRS